MLFVKRKLKWILIIIGIVILGMGHEVSEDYTDAQAKGIYDTDMNTVDCNFIPVTGATWTDYGVIMTNGHGFRSNFYVSPRVDHGRDIIITMYWRLNAAPTTITGTLLITRFNTDGADVSTTFVNQAHNILFIVNESGYKESTYTIDDSDVFLDYVYEIRWQSSDADAIVLVGIQREYFIKRIPPT